MLSVGNTYLLKYYSPTHKRVIAVDWKVTNISGPHARIKSVDLSEVKTGKQVRVLLDDPMFDDIRPGRADEADKLLSQDSEEPNILDQVPGVPVKPMPQGKSFSDSESRRLSFGSPPSQTCNQTGSDHISPLVLRVSKKASALLSLVDICPIFPPVHTHTQCIFFFADESRLPGETSEAHAPASTSTFFYGPARRWRLWFGPQ